MSLALLRAALSSRQTKSSTRFAFALMAYHACASCGRVYVSAQRLATEMNIALRNAQTLLKKLEAEHLLIPTGEHGPKGVVVYTVAVTMESSRMESSDDEIIAGDTMKSSYRCHFCTMKSSPNRQVFKREKNDKGETFSLSRETNGQNVEQRDLTLIAVVRCRFDRGACHQSIGRLSARYCDRHALVVAEEAVSRGPRDPNYLRGCELLGVTPHVA